MREIRDGCYWADHSDPTGKTHGYKKWWELSLSCIALMMELARKDGHGVDVDL